MYLLVLLFQAPGMNRKSSTLMKIVSMLQVCMRLHVWQYCPLRDASEIFHRGQNKKQTLGELNEKRLVSADQAGAIAGVSGPTRTRPAFGEHIAQPLTGQPRLPERRLYCDQRLATASARAPSTGCEPTTRRRLEHNISAVVCC